MPLFRPLLALLILIRPLFAGPAIPNIVYSTGGNQRQTLDVYFPRNHNPETNPPKPAVLCIHGGAWRGGSKADMAPFASALTEEGYVTVSMSYRLFDPVRHPENVWPAQYDDAQRAVRWMRSNAAVLGIDPGRIAAMGGSAGGHLVALLGTTDTRPGSVPAFSGISSRVNAVIDIFGPVDLTRDFRHLKLGTSTVQQLVDDFLGTKKPAAEIAQAKRESSPLFYIDAKTVPFLIFHGDKDTIVPVEQSRVMDAALRQAGIPSTYIELKGEGHGLGAPGSLDRFKRETSAFLGKVIGKP